MSVNLIKDWQDKTIGDTETNNSLFEIATFYGVDAANSFDLLGDIAVSLGYPHEDPKYLGVPYIQFISKEIAGNEDAEGGSYLQTIVNHL
jgi:hypothetical protein